MDDILDKDFKEQMAARYKERLSMGYRTPVRSSVNSSNDYRHSPPTRSPEKDSKPQRGPKCQPSIEYNEFSHESNSSPAIKKFTLTDTSRAMSSTNQPKEEGSRRHTLDGSQSESRHETQSSIMKDLIEKFERRVPGRADAASHKKNSPETRNISGLIARDAWSPHTASKANLDIDVGAATSSSCSDDDLDVLPDPNSSVYTMARSSLGMVKLNRNMKTIREEFAKDAINEFTPEEVSKHTTGSKGQSGYAHSVETSSQAFKSTQQRDQSLQAEQNTLLELNTLKTSSSLDLSKDTRNSLAPQSLTKQNGFLRRSSPKTYSGHQNQLKKSSPELFDQYFTKSLASKIDSPLKRVGLKSKVSMGSLESTPKLVPRLRRKSLAKPTANNSDTKNPTPGRETPAPTWDERQRSRGNTPSTPIPKRNSALKLVKSQTSSRASSRAAVKAPTKTKETNPKATTKKASTTAMERYLMFLKRSAPATTPIEPTGFDSANLTCRSETVGNNAPPGVGSKLEQQPQPIHEKERTDSSSQLNKGKPSPRSSKEVILDNMGLYPQTSRRFPKLLLSAEQLRHSESSEFLQNEKRLSSLKLVKKKSNDSLFSIKSKRSEKLETTSASSGRLSSPTSGRVSPFLGKKHSFPQTQKSSSLTNLRKYRPSANKNVQSRDTNIESMRHDLSPKLRTPRSPKDFVLKNQIVARKHSVGKKLPLANGVDPRVMLVKKTATTNGDPLLLTTDELQDTNLIPLHLRQKSILKIENPVEGIRKDSLYDMSSLSSSEEGDDDSSYMSISDRLRQIKANRLLRILKSPHDTTSPTIASKPAPSEGHGGYYSTLSNVMGDKGHEDDKLLDSSVSPVRSDSGQLFQETSLKQGTSTASTLYAGDGGTARQRDYKVGSLVRHHGKCKDDSPCGSHKAVTMGSKMATLRRPKSCDASYGLCHLGQDGDSAVDLVQAESPQKKNSHAQDGRKSTLEADEEILRLLSKDDSKNDFPTAVDFQSKSRATSKSHSGLKSPMRQKTKRKMNRKEVTKKKRKTEVNVDEYAYQQNTSKPDVKSPRTSPTRMKEATPTKSVDKMKSVQPKISNHKSLSSLGAPSAAAKFASPSSPKSLSSYRSVRHFQDHRSSSGFSSPRGQGQNVQNAKRDSKRHVTPASQDVVKAKNTLKKVHRVKQLSCAPTSRWPVHSQIPLIIPDGACVQLQTRRRVDVIMQYRRFLEELTNENKPSHLPVTVSFKRKMTAAAYEEYYLHRWTYKGLQDDQPSLKREKDMSTDTDLKTLTSGHDYHHHHRRLPRFLSLSRLQTIYLSVWVAMVGVAHLASRLYDCGGDDYDYYCTEDDITCLAKMVT